MTATLSLQSALFSTFTSDSQLIVAVTGVYDSIPDNAEFPYIILGQDAEVPANTLNSIGRECTVTVHIFSQYAGMKEAKEIAARIISLVERQPIPASGINVLSSSLDLAQFFTDPDGITRHGVVRFRFIVR